MSGKKRMFLAFAVLAAVLFTGIFGIWLGQVYQDAKKWRYREEVQGAKKQIFDELSQAFVQNDVEKLEKHYRPPTEGDAVPDMSAYADLKLDHPEYKYSWYTSREDMLGTDILIRYQLLAPVPETLRDIVAPVTNGGESYCFQRVWVGYEGSYDENGPVWVYNIIGWGEEVVSEGMFFGPGDGYRDP